MGAHSTIYVTRTKALEEYLKRAGSITDQELERFMDDLLYDKLYNVSIVPDNYEQNEDYLI